MSAVLALSDSVTHINLLPLVATDNFRSRTSDSGKDRFLYPWIGEETQHSVRTKAIGGFGDRSCDRVRAASTYPGRMDIRRTSNGGCVAKQIRCRPDGEALSRPRGYDHWWLGSSQDRCRRNRRAPCPEHFGRCRRLCMRVEVGIHRGARHVMRSMLSCDGENRLRVVARHAHERAHDFGRRLVVNRDGVSEMLLADEMKGDSRTVRIDMVSPKRRQSVGVIVSGIPVIPDAEQSPL